MVVYYAPNVSITNTIMNHFRRGFDNEDQLHVGKSSNQM